MWRSGPANQRASASPASASPPTVTCRSDGSDGGNCDSHCCQYAVGRSAIVTLSRSRLRFKLSQSGTSGPRITTRPPIVSAGSTWSRKASKFTVANCSTTSAAVMAWVAMKSSRCRLSAPWLTATPFGRPVEPEV